MVVFPKSLVNLDVGRTKSIESLNRGMNTNKKIFMVTQRDTMVEDPLLEDLYEIGVIGEIKQIMKLPTGIVRILVEAKSRGRLKKLYPVGKFLKKVWKNLHLSNRLYNFAPLSEESIG